MEHLRGDDGVNKHPSVTIYQTCIGNEAIPVCGCDKQHEKYKYLKVLLMSKMDEAAAKARGSSFPHWSQHPR